LPGRFVRLVAASLAAVGAALAGPVTAHAEELDEGIAFKSVSLRGNPLGMVIGRYSADLEYLPAPHHALHLSPIGYYSLPGVADELIGFGAEGGYRWYSGQYGAHGFFVGASFIALSLEYIHGAVPGVPLDSPDDTQFVQLGGAVDAGYGIIVLGSFTASAGIGAQYTVDTAQPHFEFPSHPLHDLLFGSGLRPRLLLSVGAAF
jgi:hypothetical protein